ncbi:retinoblastoma-like protein 1 [Arctopsyche grandis]|uniref:retinoblastoma-like protein 1 n=1 Tax=Arctopsyche grandis TaxID=121162 RepID=UPI00406D97CE
MAAVATEMSVAGAGAGAGVESAKDAAGGSASPVSLHQRHRDVCHELNVDERTAALSWTAYETTNNNFSLEGNPMHWIGLALYVECRQSLTPTVGESCIIEGNCVSLTKLLRLCNISLYDFFHKIKKWLEMTDKKDDFRKKIDRLERNFFVSSVLFKKLRMIFYDIFRPTDPSDTPKPSKSNKKLKSTYCTSSSLFEFAWCLFICVKCEFPDLSNDLVNMYHMMLCCINLIVGNACVAQRKDIINPDTASICGLPSNWAKTNITEPPCIISQLCVNYLGSEIEVKSMKQYKFKSVLDQFFKKKYLKGNDQTFMGLIDPVNFNPNLKSLNNTYGTYMLSVGEFDERVILGDLETGSKVIDDEISRAIAAYETQKKATSVRDTPLSGRQHLVHKNDELTPVTMAIQSMNKLNVYLLGHTNSPSPALLALFQKCEENPFESIVTRQKTMGAQFLIAYSSLSSEDMAGNRLNLIEVLYYRLLEDILKEEQRRKPHINAQWLFENDIFHKVLFACCTDIVIYTYNSYNVRFPWVLECYQLYAFDFYKVIEPIVVTTKERLSRDIVKHLNTIEENVLEILAWKGNSPVWTKISELNDPIPRWSQVRIPENNAANQPDREVQRRQPSTSVECFIPSGSESPARKQLFKDTNIKPGQSLLNMNLNNSDGSANASESFSAQPPKRANRASSLGLFFRKFYHLCSIRLQNLCTNLGLTDEQLITKIWTLLEYNIVQESNLLKDRHLDQILMCTIYAMCKVCNSPTNRVERTFRDIMRCYRLQPQAKNNIYRDVLLGDADSENVAPHSTPNRVNSQQMRGDLIQFYNSVYIVSMRDYVFLLSGKMRNEIPPLSPLPDVSRGGAASGALASEAHRVSDHCPLYVYPLNTPLSNEQSPNTFQFNRNSTKDLHDINQLMSQETSATPLTIKRLFVAIDAPPEKKPRFVMRE